MKTDRGRRTESKGKHSSDSALNTLYEQIGGMQMCRQLSERFHDRIAEDPVLRAIFPKNLDALTEHLALFLAEKFGGPADYTAKRGKNSLLCRHAHLPIGPPEVERWLGHICTAMEEMGLPTDAQQRLSAYFTETAPTLSDPFILYYNMPLDELRTVLSQNPALAAASDAGRSLLNAAAGKWDLSRVQLLLEHGANVQAPEALYRAANALAPRQVDEGRAVVELLLRYGADVNSRCGVGRMTPLHMAARRGTGAVAEALLAAGAEVEAKDTKGETPLRRAVNCGQEGVVRLLLAHGADPLCQDRKGHTSLDAARTERIREALRDAPVSEVQ